MFDIFEKIKKKVYVVAEMSANHAQSLSRAKEIIYSAKESGADAIKIQTYTPDTMTIDSDKDYFQIKSGTWENESLYTLYQKAYTPWEWQKELKDAADKVGIDFFSTPFDKTAVDFLEDMNVQCYKIASFELVDMPLIKYVASKGKTIIISTGMGTIEEIKDAVCTVRKCGNNKIILLKCSSAYPAITDEMNLATMKDMSERFGVNVGLSDHSLGSLGAITAVSMGARVIEKHFCLSREINNPDASFSMEPQEFSELVRKIRQVEQAIGKVSYGCAKQEESSVVFRRSIFVIKDIKAGDVFTEENIRIIRPGYGMHPREYEKILGKKAIVDIERGEPLSQSMIEL